MLTSRSARLLLPALVAVLLAASACTPASPRAVAVAQAEAQLGVRYVYGGASPAGFDCSGLTSWAWARAGVRIPRTAAEQYRATRRISRSQLQLGDLVFWGSGGRVTHVAMYVGGGRVVQARKPGTRVEHQSVDWWPAARMGYGQVAVPAAPRTG